MKKLAVSSPCHHLRVRVPSVLLFSDGVRQVHHRCAVLLAGRRRRRLGCRRFGLPRALAQLVENAGDSDVGRLLAQGRQISADIAVWEGEKVSVMCKTLSRMDTAGKCGPGVGTQESCARSPGS
jgi:hypothetical protein